MEIKEIWIVIEDDYNSSWDIKAFDNKEDAEEYSDKKNEEEGEAYSRRFDFYSTMGVEIDGEFYKKV